MQCGSVDELLDVTVERPVLDELKVEVLRTLEDRVQPGLTGDDGEERRLYVVDESGSHERAVHREAAVRAQRHFGLLFEPANDVDGITAHHGCVRPVERFFQRRRHHRPGGLRILVTHGSRTSRFLGAIGQTFRPNSGSVSFRADNSLPRAVEDEAASEQLGALLAAAAGPICVVAP